MAEGLAGRTLFITGGSRGIGLAIAVRAARDGANVAMLAKTAEPHPKLPGTIYTAAEEIEKAGGTALPSGAHGNRQADAAAAPGHEDRAPAEGIGHARTLSRRRGSTSSPNCSRKRFWSAPGA